MTSNQQGPSKTQPQAYSDTKDSVNEPGHGIAVLPGGGSPSTTCAPWLEQFLVRGYINSHPSKLGGPYLILGSSWTTSALGFV